MSNFKQKEFSFTSRLNSFRFAFEGFKVLLRETNFQIHLVFTFFVTCMGFYFKLNSIEWMILIFLCGFVLVSEIFNTSLEYLADSVSLEYHPIIKISKDISAFAVLVSAIISILVGCILFLPKVIHEFFI